MKLAVRDEIDAGFELPFLVDLGANALICLRPFRRSLVLDGHSAAAVPRPKRHDGVAILGLAVGCEVVHHLNFGFGFPKDYNSGAA